MEQGQDRRSEGAIQAQGRHSGAVGALPSERPLYRRYSDNSDDGNGSSRAD